MLEMRKVAELRRKNCQEQLFSFALKLFELAMRVNKCEHLQVNFSRKLEGKGSATKLGNIFFLGLILVYKKESTSKTKFPF